MTEEDDGSDDIPLDIAGHDDRERPDGGIGLFGDDGESNDPGDPASAPETTATASVESTADTVRGDERAADADTDVESNADAETAADAETDADTDAETDAEADTETDAEADPDTDAETNDDGAVEPVEVLVGLAEDGEIDPWDIDIVAVTDKFLARLDEGDLRTSGRALFYASVLLRMKGDAMLDEGDDEPEDPWDEPWEEAVADDEFADPDPFDALETEMDRRLERRRARGMPQTLDELVRDLRDAERQNWWKESREYDTSDSPEGFQRGTQELDYRSGDDLRMDEEPSAADVTGTAHDEHIDDIIDAVYDAVREQYDKGRDEVLYREVETAGGSRVETFLGLLFLSHRGQVRLRQDDLFGDLWIQDPGSKAGSEEAVAD